MKKKQRTEQKMRKKAARDRQLAEEQEFGRLRAKSWGGKDSNKKSRRKWKQDRDME